MHLGQSDPSIFATRWLKFAALDPWPWRAWPALPGPPCRAGPGPGLTNKLTCIMRWNSFDQNKDTQNTMNNTQQHISLSKQIYQKSKQEICWTLEPISVMLCMFSCLVGSTVATVKPLIGYQPCSASFISKWQSIHVSLISLTKTYAMPPGPWRAWPALRFGPGPQKTSI